MMPDKIAGKRADDGTESQISAQHDASGLLVCALVYKQFEFDNSKRLIIAAHADTSGDYKINFTITGFSNDVTLAARNYTLLLRRDTVPGRGDRIPNNNGTITVYRNVAAGELAQYMLNTALLRGTAGAIDALRYWVNAELGEPFSSQVF